MTRLLCTLLWNTCDFAGVYCPFAPWVFGRMIGAERARRNP